MDLPHINVLTKIDNLHKYGPLPFNLDFYTDVQDLSYLLPHLESESSRFSHDKFGPLNNAIVELIDEFGLVGFETLAVEDKKSMMNLLRVIDKASGYAFGPAEGANDSIWQVAVREGLGTMDVRDVQERWLDAKDEYDEAEREELRKEAEARRGRGEEGEGEATEDLAGNDDDDLMEGLRGPPIPDSGVKVVRKS